MMGRTLAQTEEKPRERRKIRDGSMGGFEKKMVFPAGFIMDPNYTYRFVNERNNGLAAAHSKDWDFVDAKGSEVNPRSKSRCKVYAGTLKDGNAYFAYGMRKLKEWYDADKAADQMKIDEDMKQLQRNAKDDRAAPTGLNIKVS